MIIIVLVSLMGHMVIAGIDNYYLLPLPILYSLCLWQAPSWSQFLAWLDDPSLYP